MVEVGTRNADFGNRHGKRECQVSEFRAAGHDACYYYGFIAVLLPNEIPAVEY